MKYYKKSNRLLPLPFIIFFVLIIISLSYINRDILTRSLITVNMGSLYVEFLNEKAEFLNFINNNKIESLSISMSPNNYVRMQKERSKMVNNFVLNGSQWSGANNYYKAKVNDGNIETSSEIRLFGMNSDHFRSVNGHSFRLKFDGNTGYGNKKVNYLNPRSRDFITDPLINIIFSKLYGGIGINYKPVRITLNKANYGILYQEDFFDKYLIEQNKRRESVIFEIVNDSINFNYNGDNNSLDLVAYEIEQFYRQDFKSFLNIIDITKLKDALKLGLLINDEHPFSEINLHWYYNPVTNLIEPTLREGFIKKIEQLNIDRIALNNPIIKNLLTEELKLEILSELKEEIYLIKEIISNNEDYLDFKNKISGFAGQVSQREKLFLFNADFIIGYTNSKSFNQSNKKDEIIKITNNTLIDYDLIINGNQKLIISPGVELKINNAYIKIYGGFEAVGTSNKPIKISGINNSGTIFINSQKNIVIDNVIFENLTNRLSKFEQPAAITFYETNSVKITNSNFLNNLSGDDFLNFFRSNDIIIKSSYFKNILNDAIDSDFSNVTISNTIFDVIGNDAIDGSGSNLIVDQCKFSYVRDKAISAGEKSVVEVTNSLFSDNEIAVVSKDASKVLLQDLNFINNNIDFSSFVKKSYFGPSETIFKNTYVNKYLIENNSKIIGKDSILFSTNVESKLYGNLYGRASQ